MYSFVNTVLKISQNVPQLLHHSVTEQIISFISSTRGTIGTPGKLFHPSKRQIVLL